MYNTFLSVFNRLVSQEVLPDDFPFATIQSQAKAFENADAELVRADVLLNVFIWRISDNEETPSFPDLGPE